MKVRLVIEADLPPYAVHLPSLADDVRAAAEESLRTPTINPTVTVTDAVVVLA